MQQRFLYAVISRRSVKEICSCKYHREMTVTRISSYYLGEMCVTEILSCDFFGGEKLQRFLLQLIEFAAGDCFWEISLTKVIQMESCDVETKTCRYLLKVRRPRWLHWMRVQLVIRRLLVRPPPGRQHSFVEF